MFTENNFDYKNFKGIDVVKAIEHGWEVYSAKLSNNIVDFLMRKRTEPNCPICKTRLNIRSEIGMCQCEAYIWIASGWADDEDNKQQWRKVYCGGSWNIAKVAFNRDIDDEDSRTLNKVTIVFHEDGEDDD